MGSAVLAGRVGRAVLANQRGGHSRGEAAEIVLRCVKQEPALLDIGRFLVGGAHRVSVP